MLRYIGIMIIMLQSFVVILIGMLIDLIFIWNQFIENIYVILMELQILFIDHEVAIICNIHSLMDTTTDIFYFGKDYLFPWSCRDHSQVLSMTLWCGEIVRFGMI